MPLAPACMEAAGQNAASKGMQLMVVLESPALGALRHQAMKILL